MPISPVPLKSPCQVHATFTPHTQQTVNRFPLPLSQDVEKTLVLMWLAKFANDASSMVHLRSSPWHIPCQPYGRLSIVVHYPSVSIRAAQSGLQSAPACRMRWVCHHLPRSYDRNLSNIANIGLYSVSGHTFYCKFSRNCDNFCSTNDKRLRNLGSNEGFYHDLQAKSGSFTTFRHLPVFSFPKNKLNKVVLNKVV